MFSLKRIFGLPTSKPAPVTESYPPELQLVYEKVEFSADFLDEAFGSLLFGGIAFTESPLNAFEKLALGELEDLLGQDLQQKQLLPRIPSVLPQVIQSLKNENTDARDIALLIEKDPALVGEVMRLVNTPFYRTREKLTNLQQATTMLGREGLRKLVTGAIVRPLLNINNGHFSKQASAHLWNQSEKIAQAASILCTGDEEKVFQAYLAGILHNIGFTVGFKMLDKLDVDSNRLQSIQFEQEFVNLCRKMTQKIMRNWSMPKIIFEAMDINRENFADEQLRLFAESLYIADKLSKAAMLSKQQKLDPLTAKVIKNRETCSQCRYAFEAISQ